ncbi:MAG: hypothetical protein IIU28_03390 [Lachnospiraceae bacterium]|nr:hypothetical protein [Lachnospiraceae bacterium]
MTNKKKKHRKAKLIIINHILTIIQLCCCGFGFYALTRFSAFAAGTVGNEISGTLLITLSIACTLAMLPLSIANAVISVLILRRYGRRMHTLLTFVFSVFTLVMAGGIVLTEMI